MNDQNNLFDSPPPPPPSSQQDTQQDPQQAPHSEPQNDDVEIFRYPMLMQSSQPGASQLPEIERKARPDADEGIKSYFQTQIRLPQLREQFSDYCDFFTFNHPTRDNGLKPLTGNSKDIELNLTGAQTRIGLGFGPLLSLHADLPKDRRVADAILAIHRDSPN